MCHFNSNPFYREQYFYVAFKNSLIVNPEHTCWIDPLTFPRRRVWVGRDRFPPARPQRENQRRRRVESRNADAVSFLESLSEVSAGRYYNSDASDFTKTFNLIAEELRHQYRLGFYPDAAKTDGQRHGLRVQVSIPDAVVRARRSYQAAPRTNGL